ncbi:MAG: hypothetical protein ACT4RN_18955 [Pseudonocardia sp.]
MDLTRWLLRAGAARPHVLVVPAPGSPGARLAVEAELARRGWPHAQSPAGADVLVVAGQPGPRLSEVVETLWVQMPEPRARVQVADAAAVTDGLDGAAVALADPTRQRATPRQVARPAPGAADAAAHEGHGGGHGAMDAMEMPGGLPMADVGADRDGLTLDRVHVPLGPVLPDWPAGLVARVVLQGDVVQEAEVELIDRPPASAPFWSGPERAVARELDGLGRFLAVAGWDDGAARARRLRDDLLAGASDPRRDERIRALARRVRRSWVLGRLVRGIPVGDTDVAALLEQRLAVLTPVAAPGRRATPQHPPATRPELADLALALVGQELAALRLVVAAVDPDTDSDADTDAAALPVADPGQARHG